jgi:hypothetical protein
MSSSITSVAEFSQRLETAMRDVDQLAAVDADPMIGSIQRQTSVREAMDAGRHTTGTKGLGQAVIRPDGKSSGSRYRRATSNRVL